MWKPFAALALSAVALSACAAAPPPEPAPDAAASACRAEAYQHLVGRPKSAIPQTPAGAIWRVACTTCPVTMDFNPQRLNIFFDEASGIIRQVKCG